MLDILIEMYLYTKHSLIQKPELLWGSLSIIKEIIAGGKISEDPLKGSFVTWNITSH